MALTTTCFSCGADNAPEGARFCPNCGRSLSNDDQVPMAPATPVSPQHEGDPLQVSSVSVEPTVEVSRVTYDESSSNAPLTTSQATQQPIPLPAAASSQNCVDGSSINRYSKGGIECANYFKSPTPVMMQRAKLEAMGGVLFVALNCCHQGKFTLSETIAVGRILGSVRLDLSMADFVFPVTTITVGTILGGLKVTVPRGVRVETLGLGILGSFSGLRGGQTVHAGQEAPLVIIRGLSILAGVKVVVNEDAPPIQIVE